MSYRFQIIKYFVRVHRVVCIFYFVQLKIILGYFVSLMYEYLSVRVWIRNKNYQVKSELTPSWIDNLWPKGWLSTG